MENICSRYPVNYNEESIGSAEIEKVGIRFLISAEIRENPAKPPYRLAVICENGTIPLGVMMPITGGYIYRKVFTAGALREMKIAEVKGFTIIADNSEKNVYPTSAVNASAADWKRIHDPGILLEEGEFRRIFSACEESLVKCEGDLTYLAVPIVKGKEFPAMPVFCLGEAHKINNELYLVFKIHNGKLSF